MAIRTLLAILLALSLLAIAGPRPARAVDAVATATRVGGDDKRTRFVADLTKAVSYTVFVLPDPYRVIIDMPDITFNLPPGTGQKTRGLISEYRYGQIAAGRSRIVLDTAGPVLIEKSFIVDPQAGQPARIVVDLVPISEEAFLKTYREEENGRDEVAALAEAATEDVAPLPIPELETVSPPLSKKKTAPRANGRKLVVIDPGHGGIDPGAVGVNRTKEKDIVLAFALSLREHLLRGGQYEVVMTRTADKFVSLKDRVRIARENAADLFIAIHADTVRGQQARGLTIYTLSEKASDAEAEALAHKENRSDIIAGLDLGAESEEVTDILIDLVQRESKSHSMVFARKAVSEMKPVTGFTGKPLRSAGFVVLKAPDVPSVLVELGYLSSRHDEAQLSSPSWRDKVAGAMTSAIDKYFATEVAQRGK
ncbi:MAG: N-acetylmuramoyl-L-alanine amidase [Rhizobiales bacterium]|nr:N-acetylmuramoyl-L-alanine amidase [Hyphomicrobiales bacterium]